MDYVYRQGANMRVRATRVKKYLGVGWGTELPSMDEFVRVTLAGMTGWDFQNISRRDPNTARYLPPWTLLLLWVLRTQCFGRADLLWVHRRYESRASRLQNLARFLLVRPRESFQLGVTAGKWRPNSEI